MLKIIPTSETNNEEYICKEMQIKSLYEFFSSSTPKEIIDKVYMTFKEERKTDKMAYDKLIFITSLIIRSNAFDSNEKSKKLLNNVIETVSLLKDIPAINGFDDVLSLLSSSYDNLKEYLLNVLYGKDTIGKEKKVIQLFIANYLSDTSDKAIEEFSTYINTKHCYSILTQFTLPSALLIKSKSISSINSLRLLFYIVFTSEELLKCNIKDLKQKMTNSKSELQCELELIDLIEKRDYLALTQYDYNKKLNNIYDQESVEVMSSYAKLAGFHSIISSIYKTKKQILFKELETLTKASFDSIEDILTEGHIKNLFKMKIDYETETVTVFYVKQFCYSKDDINLLINEIASMRAKFSLVSKSISLI